MIDLIIELFTYASILSYLLPVIAATKYRSGLVKVSRPIFVLVFSDFLFVLLEIVFAFWISNSNPIQHVSVFISTIIIFSYYYSIKFHRTVLLILFTLACFFFVYETFISNRIMYNNTLMSVFSNVSISLISFIHLFQLFRYDDKNVLEFKFLFYVSTAFFIFNSSSFYINLFDSHIRTDVGYLLAIIYPVFSILLVVQNVFISKAIWTLKRVWS
jgi:hypothetical protein